MSEILFHYQKINPTTWVYLSSLLMVALFFQFNRFWSVRNLDLVLLILLAPGLLMVNQSMEISEATLLQANAKEAANATKARAVSEPAETEKAPVAADSTAANGPQGGGGIAIWPLAAGWRIPAMFGSWLFRWFG